MSRNPNRMQEAVDTLMDKFTQAASIVVTYVQGATTITGLSATVGRTPFEIEEGGVLTSYESRDYIVAAGDFIDDTTGQPVVPASGCLITETVSGTVYTVTAPKPMNVYESIGPDGSVLKIHTKAYNG